ncbi:unnamed protein product [Prunus armeniaca]
MTAWVRINGLKVEYFRSDVMEKIGNLIGATVKVDAHTMSQDRGKFARVCVELDLAKPLTPFSEVEGHSYRNMEVNISDKSGDLSVNNPVTKDVEIPAKMHGQWMLIKPRSFNTKKVEDSGKDDMEGFTPVSTRGNVKFATPSGFGSSYKAKSYGKQPSHPRESSPWVFKNPLKDITNASVSKVGGVVVKGGPNLRKPCRNEVGVQDDVRGVFSFNVVGSPFNDSSLGQAGLVNSHDPPNISRTKLYEAKSSSVSIASNDMDQHGISLGLTSGCSLWFMLILVLGFENFNDIVCAKKKCGGNLDNGGQTFIDWIDHNHLVDLGFFGANFTWCNKRNSEGIIWKRLDRGLCNIEWRLLFHEAHLSHLPRVNSDNCPLLVKLLSNHAPARAFLPFRFQAMWLSHPDFSKFIYDIWSSRLFNVSVSTGEYSLLPQLFSQLGCEDLAGLSGTITELEMKHSLFAIGGLKTLGLDGFLDIFYQNFWDLCSSDIISVVKYYFITASLPEHLNDTLIALVPKAERPTSIPQLRPISLCNTLYKVVSKIHVARLRPLMSKLVSPTQVSFVLGKRITDNIVVAQELLYKFKISKRKKGFVAWKIDLSKAYDHLSWNFIREVFWEVGIRGRILELLMICISYVQYKVVLNGELTETFVPKCGIRQGDPLSPYILSCAWRNFLILLIKEFRIKSGTSVTQAKVMKQCLDDFCNLSGQRVSFEKSMICVSPNTCSDLARQLAFISGSPLTDCLGKYLGVPLIHKKVTKATYFEIVDKKTAWMNQALLAKTGWRLLQNDQGLLSQILNAKYLSCSSSVWRGVLYGAKLLPHGL